MAVLKKYCDHFWPILALTLVLSPAKLKAQQKSDIIEAREISLSRYKTDAVNADSSFKDAIVFSGHSIGESRYKEQSDEVSVWILGRTSLWKWDLRQNALTQITLDKTSSYPRENGNFDEFKTPERSELVHRNTCCIGTDGRSIFAGINNHLYILDLKSNKVFKLSLPSEKLGDLLGFTGEGDDFWMLFKKGILQFDPYTKGFGQLYTLVNSLPINLPDGSDKLIRNIKKSKLKGVFYIKQARAILKLDVNATNPKMSSIFKTSNTILSIQFNANDLVLATEHSVLRLDTNGQLLQAMPVENRRTIVALDINAKQHSYLFSDGLMEVYSQNDKKIKKYLVPVNLPIKAKDIRVTNDYLIMIEQGNIGAYKL